MALRLAVGKLHPVDLGQFGSKSALQVNRPQGL
jgi:hypothetical protein